MTEEKILTRRKAGRPCKLTESVAQRIVNAVKSGAYLETACAFAGVAKSTFYEWLRKGRNQRKGKFQRFADAIEKAIAGSEIRDLLVIDKAAQSGDWRAAAWRLERKNPKQWGPKKVLEVSGPDGEAPKFVVIEGAAKVASEDEWAASSAQEAAQLQEERKAQAASNLQRKLDEDAKQNEAPAPDVPPTGSDQPIWYK
jgi:hypothetical protein